MESDLKQWEPEHVVALVNSLAWPAVTLMIAIFVGLLVWKGRALLSSTFKQLLKDRSLRSMSADKSGFQLELEPIHQEAKRNPAPGAMQASSGDEPLDLPAILAEQERNFTPYSRAVLHDVVSSFGKLKATDDQKLEVLFRAFSLLYCHNRFTDAAKALFQSQYYLLEAYVRKGSEIPKSAMERYFSNLKAQHSEEYSPWEVSDYVEYLLAVELLIESKESYLVTEFGKSFVEYMQRAPESVESLGKL